MNPFLLLPCLASAAYPVYDDSIWKTDFWNATPKVVEVSGGVAEKPKKHYANLLSKADAIALVEKSQLYVKASESAPMTMDRAELSEGLAEHPMWDVNISYEGRSPIPPQLNFYVDAVTSELYGYDRRKRGAIVEYYQKDKVDETRIFSWEVGKAKHDPEAKPSPIQNVLRTILQIGEQAMQPRP
jgi:hypothetical protein